MIVFIVVYESVDQIENIESNGFVASGSSQDYEYNQDQRNYNNADCGASPEGRSSNENFSDGKNEFYLNK